MTWHAWLLAALQAGALGIGPVRLEFDGGYQIEFTSDFPDLRYHVWDREWFVDRSRTVGVVCVASEDEWERLLPDLVHVVEGFDASPD